MLLELKEIFNNIIKDKAALISILIAAVIFAVPDYLNALAALVVYLGKQAILPAMMSFKFALFVKGLIPLVTIITSSFATGFMLQVAHSYIHEERKIPEWEGTNAKFFKDGFLFNYIIMLVYALFVVGGIAAALFAFWNSIAANQIATLIKNKTYGPIINHLDAFLPAIAIAVALIIAFSVIYQFIVCAYAENFKFTQAFNVVKIFKRIFCVFPQYLLYLLVFLIIGLLCSLLNVLLAMLLIGFIFNPLILFAEFFAQTVVFSLLYRDAVLKERNSSHNVEVID